jgi:hypothetical protein
LKYTGKIIALAFPEVFVKRSTDLICKFLPFVGVGTKQYIKAGHAALLLIENKTGLIRYFDFGRYSTPDGYGRLRCIETDAELHIGFKAILAPKGTLQNLEQILHWLTDNPQKINASGRLLASVCDTINYNKAKTYLLSLQDRGSIPYALFDKNSSNCSRVVANTILQSTDTKKIINRLNFNKLFTPSTVGNVKVAASNGIVYEVTGTQIKHFTSIPLKENIFNLFDKNVPPTLCPKDKVNAPEHWCFLEGIGSSTYFEMVPCVLPANHFRIKRYNTHLVLDFDGVFVSNKFDSTTPYKFTYDSHCKHCHILQGGEKIKLNCVGAFSEFNS